MGINKEENCQGFYKLEELKQLRKKRIRNVIWIKKLSNQTYFKDSMNLGFSTKAAFGG